MTGLYHLDGARTPEQADDMRQLDAAGVCILCPPHLADDPDQQILYCTDQWTVTPNQYPYDGTALHLLLVPDAHRTDLLNLPEPALADFWRVLGWVRRRYNLAHYSLGVRCGDCRYTGATIAHVHAHVVVADPAGPPARFRMSGRSGR